MNTTKTKTDSLSEALTLTLNRFFRGRAIWHGALWIHVAHLTLTRPSRNSSCLVQCSTSDNDRYVN